MDDLINSPIRVRPLTSSRTSWRHSIRRILNTRIGQVLPSEHESVGDDRHRPLQVLIVVEQQPIEKHQKKNIGELLEDFIIQLATN
jgi:hypothetical protein